MITDGYNGDSSNAYGMKIKSEFGDDDYDEYA
jgi:hypothetical protein